MMSSMERRKVRNEAYTRICNEIAEENRNGQALFTPNEAIRRYLVFLDDHPEMQRKYVIAAKDYKDFEKENTNPCSRDTADGQREFAFGYSPNSVVKLSKIDRVFMKDMSFANALKRLQLLQRTLKNTTDGVHVQMEYYTQRMEVWDHAKHKVIDDVEKEVFGWTAPAEEPPINENSEDEFENED